VEKEILYIPEFRDELFESGLNLFDANEGEYLKKNWLTQGIVEEIENQFPTAGNKIMLPTAIKEIMQRISVR
jgi:hypothetical protein